jgi:hypothetical protein
MSKKEKTVTLQAEVAVTEMENGMRYVQVFPDDPRVGMVTPFVGNGRGQMLSNGTFDFVQRKRVRRKPEFKGKHIALSFGQDGTDRVIFTLPNGQRDELRTLLMEDVLRLTSYLEEQGW